MRRSANRVTLQLCLLLTLGCGPQAGTGAGVNDIDSSPEVRVVGSQDSTLVVVVDPSRCLSCDAALAVLLETHRRGGPVKLILTAPPTELQRKHLALGHIRPDTILAIEEQTEEGVAVVVHGAATERLSMEGGARLLRQMLAPYESSVHTTPPPKE